MSAPTLSVDPQWVAQTLTPYLRYAFKHVLRRNLDIAPYVQQALDFSKAQPISSTDGNDLVFERVFFAIERRHQGLPAELNGLTENLNLLAKFLIRRAQLKGPFELLHRNVQPSEAWKKYESVRLAHIAADKARGPDHSASTADYQRAPSTPIMTARTLHADHNIDPRLLHALPGQFTEAGLSGTLTIPEWQHYQRRNQEIEAFRARGLGQLPSQQADGLQQPSHSSGDHLQAFQHETLLPVWQGQHDGTVNGTRLQYALNPAFQQQYAPSYPHHMGQQQTVVPSQLPLQIPIPIAQMYTSVQPAQKYLPLSGSHQPIGHPSLAPMQCIKPPPVNIATMQSVQPYRTIIEPQSMHAPPGPPSTHRIDAPPGLRTLTRPAGISKSTFNTSATVDTPDWSDPAQRAASLAAFKKLPRAEKVAKILELNRAAELRNPTVLTPVERFFRDQKVAADTAAASRVAGGGGQMIKQSNSGVWEMADPRDQQAIMVPAPNYQTHQGVQTATPAIGAFVHHPGYSNITSSFPSRVQSPPIDPALLDKREKK